MIPYYDLLTPRAYRDEVFAAYRWHHTHAVQEAKAGRIFGDRTRAEQAAALADAARWRRRLAFMLEAAR